MPGLRWRDAHAEQLDGLVGKSEADLLNAGCRYVQCGQSVCTMRAVSMHNAGSRYARCGQSVCTMRAAGMQNTSSLI